MHDTSGSETVNDRAVRIAGVGYDPHRVQRELVVVCGLCGSNRHIEVSRHDRYGYLQPLNLCARCGLGFLSPRPTASAYGEFYSGVYRRLVSAYHGRLIDEVTVQSGQQVYAEELTIHLESRLSTPPLRVLDIGGSTGVVGGAFRQAYGSEVTVLDPAPDELAVAANAGMETIAGFAEDVDFGGRTWDLVLLCQTIDHLLDVRATLEVIRTVLAPDGRAFIDVLDPAWVLGRAGTIEGVAKVDHPHYLTRPVALAFFASCGLVSMSERMADDGHWGFVLATGDVTEPDWAELRLAHEEFLAEIGRRRAAGDH